MHIRIVLFLLAISLVNVSSKKHDRKEHTAEIHHTDCYRFSQNARFNPYSVLDMKWFVFYHWGSTLESRAYTFHHPRTQIDKILHHMLDDYVKKPVNWSAKRVLLIDAQNLTRLLVERNHSGYYHMYDLAQGLVKGKDFVRPKDVRIKQKNGYIGIMFCKQRHTIVMSRIDEVPPKNQLLEAATSLGVHGRYGRSYLYQGHHWMPIGEAEEDPLHEYLHYRGIK